MSPESAVQTFWLLQMLPTTFEWPLFGIALLLMASPALHQVVFVPGKKATF